MDRLSSFSNESSLQYLEKLGLASNDNSNNAERISKELLQFPIDVFDNELNNSSLQFHLKAENNRISYKIVDFGKQNNKINHNNFLERDLSGLTSLSALSAFQQQTTQATMGRVTPTRSVKKRQPPTKSASISPSPTNGNTKNNADKRSKHNEIERKRRDKINNWIIKLSKIVPDCAGDSSKQSQSKGVILSKACDFITDLKKKTAKLHSVQEENNKLRQELNESREESNECRKDLNELTREIDQLKTLLKENHITIKESRNKK